MSDHFIQIQCPSCASTEVELVNAPTYRCRHCSSSFIFRDPRPVAPPPAPPAPPPPSMYGPSPYGPSPYGAQPHVIVTHTGGGAGRWIVWMIVMLVVFGGSGVSAFIAWFNGVRTTTTTASSTTTTPTAAQPKKTPTAAIVPTPAVAEVPKPAAAATPEPAPEVAAQPEIDLSAFQSLSGCGCRTDVDGDTRKDQIDLYLQAGSSAVITAAGSDHFVDLTFAVAGEGLKPFALPTTEETAPAKRYHAGRIGLGVGCEGDTMVIAALDQLSGWSLAKRELRWTRKLAPAFSRFAEGKAAVDCSSIPVSGGVAKVRTESGTQSLRIDTGTEDRSSGSSRPPSSSSAARPSPTPKPEPATKPEPTPKPEQKSERKPTDPKIPVPTPKKEPRKPKQPDPVPTPDKKKKKGKKLG